MLAILSNKRSIKPIETNYKNKVLKMKLSNILNACTVYAAKNDIRYYLNGVCLYFKKADYANKPDVLQAVAATDGHCLVMCSFDYSVPLKDCESVILSHEDVKKVVAVYGNCEAEGFEVGQLKELCETVEGRYPDISRVIPEENRHCDLSYGIGLDVKLLSKLDKFTTKIKKGYSKGFPYNYKFHFETARDSVLVTNTFEDVNIKMSHMPIRLETL